VAGGAPAARAAGAAPPARSGRPRGLPRGACVLGGQVAPRRVLPERGCARAAVDRGGGGGGRAHARRRRGGAGARGRGGLPPRRRRGERGPPRRGGPGAREAARGGPTARGNAGWWRRELVPRRCDFVGVEQLGLGVARGVLARGRRIGRTRE